MKSKMIVLSICISVCLVAGANFPFPRNSVLYGIKTSTNVAAIVQSNYETWLSTYYIEEDTLARISWDNREQTASEGIAYGMLIMVCMENYQNKTKEKFDKLWRYYKKFKDGNGVMNWKINGFTSVADDGFSGATDAELDAATALILAFRQWGENTYRSDAQELIAAIWKNEVNSEGFLKPGDIWDERKNPSYFNIGAMELFKSIDSNDWDRVIENSFNLLKKVCDASTGLPPDWCSQDGENVVGDFGWEAIRVPWRMAWTYSWFGIREAYTVNDKIVRWIRKVTSDDPNVIKSLYSLSGVPEGDANAAYTGALTCAGLISAENQNWVDAGFITTQYALSNTYYKKTLQVLYSLLLSGNFSLMQYSESIRNISPVKNINSSPRQKFLFISADHKNLFDKYYSLSGRKINTKGPISIQLLTK